MNIIFEALGIPKGQPRARAFAQRFGNKYSARMYDPGTADEWKECVYYALRAQLDTLAMTSTLDSVGISMRFTLPRPKSHFGKKGLKPNAPKQPVGKPDIDNLSKLVLDVITKDNRVWRDDSQVIGLLAWKCYEDAENAPGVWVCIATNGDVPAQEKDLREDPPEV